MPHAAPGEEARGAVRRKLPQKMMIPVLGRGGCLSSRHGDLRMKKYIERRGSGSIRCSSFTQQLSGIGVGRGRLGEVVSQVGDCRPPPPGNPRRPSITAGVESQMEGEVYLIERLFGGGYCVSPGRRNFWGIIMFDWKRSSFNNDQKHGNLKILNSCEYFKEYCSYFSCTRNQPVLEFGSFPLPHVRATRSGTPIYSGNKCSKNAGILNALPLL